MAYGIGWVRATAIVSFIFGALVNHAQTVNGTNLIEVLGFLSLLSGMAWMVGSQGAVGVLGGFLDGFGLGVTFSAFFWPPPTLPLPIPFA